MWKGDEQFTTENREKGMTDIGKIAEDLIDIMCSISRGEEENYLKELKREIKEQSIKTFYLIHW